MLRMEKLAEVCTMYHVQHCNGLSGRGGGVLGGGSQLSKLAEAAKSYCFYFYLYVGVYLFFFTLFDKVPLPKAG